VRARVVGMPDYRVYVVGEDGHFKNAHEFECANDAEAVTTARQLVDHRDLELWCLDRFIEKIHGKKSQRG
jgi:hypothetical protein